MSDEPLRAPFPWFGGKRWVAETIWARLGDVDNYVEPFFGSGAVLLARPQEPRTETINDADRFVANFWRATRAAPGEVAAYCDWPVNEADLAARHYWLVTEGARRLMRCEGDPDFYDAKVAGWWCWGACAWIGSGWCSGEGPWVWGEAGWENGSAGMGINRKLPHLGDAGRGEAIREWFAALGARLRHVRVACGDWERVCGPSVTWRHGLTGVFLDPPYGADDRADVYSVECRDVSRRAAEWAQTQGANPLMRICFAGYAEEHNFPPEWERVPWKARGGFGSQGDGQGRANAAREMLWFSPACLKPEAAAQQMALAL